MLLVSADPQPEPEQKSVDIEPLGEEQDLDPLGEELGRQAEDLQRELETRLEKKNKYKVILSFLPFSFIEI